MSQPLDRTCEHPALGEIDHAAGEFWVGNPFDLPANGENLSAFERNRLYLNRRGQSFLDASFASSADIDSDSRSVAVADFDGDGLPDLLVGSVGGGPLRLFLNRMPQGRRLRIALQGKQSNRAGVGARVIAEIGDRRIVRDAFPPNGCQGGGPVWLSIGAGDAERIDRLTIRWPTGVEQSFRDVAAEGRVRILEGEEQLQSFRGVVPSS